MVFFILRPSQSNTLKNRLQRKYNNIHDFSIHQHTCLFDKFSNWYFFILHYHARYKAYICVPHAGKRGYFAIPRPDGSLFRIRWKTSGLSDGQNADTTIPRTTLIVRADGGGKNRRFIYRQMNFKRLLTTPNGVLLISILLGLGIACLFRKVCTDDHCIDFKGAVITTIHNKVYEHNKKCFTYVAKSVTCNPTHKTIVDVTEPIVVDWKCVMILCLKCIKRICSLRRMLVMLNCY